jgi:hypothetical protein
MLSIGSTSTKVGFQWQRQGWEWDSRRGRRQGGRSDEEEQAKVGDDEENLRTQILCSQFEIDKEETEDA